MPDQGLVSVEKYVAARCLNSEFLNSDHRTRSWHQTLRLRDGSKLAIKGAAVPGGGIEGRSLPDQEWFEIAQAPDYIYPTDVRIDPEAEVLYVKADGILALGGRATWLFEYDLTSRTLLAKSRVDASELPNECLVP